MKSERKIRLAIILWAVSGAFLFLVFSYSFLDLALSLYLQQKNWTFLENLRQWHDFHRPLSRWLYYLFLLWLSSFLMIGRQAKTPALILKNRFFWPAIIIATGAAFSYNFLSHDLFSYLFYARMDLAWGLDPYQSLPETLKTKDLWYSFIRNIDSLYLYGPGFLFLTKVLGLLAGVNRLIGWWLLYKTASLILFLATGFILRRRFGMPVFSYWFFNSLLIIEWLVNGHNDLWFICPALLAGLAAEVKGRWPLLGLVPAAVSLSMKPPAVSFLPLLVFFYLPEWQGKRSHLNLWAQFLYLAVFTYLLYFPGRPTLPWYFSWLMLFLPWLEPNSPSVRLMPVFNILILLGYSGYVEHGVWLAHPIAGVNFLFFLLWIWQIIYLIKKIFGSMKALRGREISKPAA